MNKLACFFIFFIFSANIGVAQNSSDTIRKFHGTSIGIGMDWHVGMARFENTVEESVFYQDIENVCELNLEVSVNWGVEFRMAQQISKHFEVEIGIEFSKKSFSYEDSDLDFYLDWLDTTYLHGPIPVTSSAYSYSFIRIPVKFYAYSNKNNSGLFLGAGVVPNFLVGTHQFIEEADLYANDNLRSGKQQFEYNNFSADLMFSGGGAFNFSKILSGKVEATYQYDITGINEAPVKISIDTFGVGFYIYYKLN